MGKQGLAENAKTLPLVNRAEHALPIEYRYRTGFTGSLFAGLLILIAKVVMGNGNFSGVFIIIGLILSIYGLVGFFADPEGVWQTAGKRLIISDEYLQEVDEEWRVRWVVLPGEVKSVEKHLGRAVLPFGVNRDWRVEVWEIVLRDGKRRRIPVWLLPQRGRNFKQRFETFLLFGRRQLKETTTVD